MQQSTPDAEEETIVMNTRNAQLATPIGAITLVATGNAVTGLYFPSHRYMPPVSTFGARVEIEDDAVLSMVATQLEEYFRGERDTFTVPTSANGDPFQKKVWALLADIPFGTTTTYGDLAERLGNKDLAQRVGKVVGQNPLCIITPCHRVIGKNGKLTGYAGGLPRKRFLLELEAPAETGAATLFEAAVL